MERQPTWKNDHSHFATNTRSEQVEGQAATMPLAADILKWGTTASQVS